MICVTQRVRSDSAALCPELAYHIYSILLNRLPDKEYAAYLHTGREKTPLSITVLSGRENPCEGTVRICLFHEEAAERFLPLIPSDCYRLKKRRCVLAIQQMQEKCFGEEELLTHWFRRETAIPEYIDVHFLTPTAFSKHRHTLPMPEIYGLLRAAAQQLDQLHLSQTVEPYLLAELEKAIVVQRCDIHTVPFPFKPGLATYGFTGTLRLQLCGADALNRLVYLLLYIGQYTGVGVRTALGMGRIEVAPSGSLRRKK